MSNPNNTVPYTEYTAANAIKSVEITIGGKTLQRSEYNTDIKSFVTTYYDQHVYQDAMDARKRVKQNK